MPMYRALKLCPDAVILRPRMKLYAEISRQIRTMMLELTPAVEPISLDEAFLDLTGTERLHKKPPAVLLAELTSRLKNELGLTGSVGLSHNKFLAKVASDLDKPSGFSIIGKFETEKFLSTKPVNILWGVGAGTKEKLAAMGIKNLNDLKRWDESDFVRKFGSSGKRLKALASGKDNRRVLPERSIKSISNETTFGNDVGQSSILVGHLWRMCEKVSDRAKSREIAGKVGVLKLKTSKHRLITRRLTFKEPTNIADRLFSALEPLLKNEIKEVRFRLLGVTLMDLCDQKYADLTGDLLDPYSRNRERAELASDQIRKKFGVNAIIKGRSLR
uniref:DNA-directed DNA polymerase n=1 Tax=uncultured Rhodobacterales bacterium HF0070_10D05 TaxID=710784 RepID=E0XS00_9RHOB|nr:nucleotidyltransferase/DNA polymerase Involved in DNA repair [uncultured Rhodobacterales bacterium HF0070_10D05]